MPVKTKIQVRRDTAANWTSTNPTLAAGEQGWETDTKRMKVGDGTTAWTSLAYFGPTAKLVQESNTTVTVSNTTTQTDLFSFSQAAVADTSLYRLTATGTYRNNSGGSVTYTFRLKIGATTLFTSAAINAVNANETASWKLDWFVNMVGSRSSQKSMARFMGARGTSTWSDVATFNLVGYGTATEDLSTAKTWAFTVAMGTANANTNMILQSYSLEEITE